MITISNLKKCFGEKVAVNVSDYTINQGTMLGLVGNNGAVRLPSSALSSTSCRPMKERCISTTSTYRRVKNGNSILAPSLTTASSSTT